VLFCPLNYKGLAKKTLIYIFRIIQYTIIGSEAKVKINFFTFAEQTDYIERSEDI